MCRFCISSCSLCRSVCKNCNTSKANCNRSYYSTVCSCKILLAGSVPRAFLPPSTAATLLCGRAPAHKHSLLLSFPLTTPLITILLENWPSLILSFFLHSPPPSPLHLLLLRLFLPFSSASNKIRISSFFVSSGPAASVSFPADSLPPFHFAIPPPCFVFSSLLFSSPVSLPPPLLVAYLYHTFFFFFFLLPLRTPLPCWSSFSSLLPKTSGSCASPAHPAAVATASFSPLQHSLCFVGVGVVSSH